MQLEEIIEETEEERDLLTIIKDGEFEEIESKLKPSAFTYYFANGTLNTLLISMKVRGYFCSRITASSMFVYSVSYYCHYYSQLLVRHFRS